MTATSVIHREVGTSMTARPGAKFGSSGDAELSAVNERAGSCAVTGSRTVGILHRAAESEPRRSGGTWRTVVASSPDAGSGSVTGATEPELDADADATTSTDKVARPCRAGAADPATAGG